MGNEAPVYPPYSTGPRSGLTFLRDAVATYFQEYDVPAVVAKIGLKYRSFGINQNPMGGANRVVFIPGEFGGGTTVSARKYGTLTRGNRNHASVVNPRELLSWDRPFTLSVWAAPPKGEASDEGATITAAEDLLEQVVRAVNSAGMADITWGAVTINSPPSDNGFGVELLVSATQRGPLFDLTLDTVQAKPAVPTKDMV